MSRWTPTRFRKWTPQARGVSSFIATPSWQTGTGVPAARAGRYSPDIAFSSAAHDGYFACLAAAGNSCVPSSNGSYTFEYFYGTSAAAPSMAGIAALLNQSKGGAQGNLNPQLYQLAARAPVAFHDVTVASSGVGACSIGTPSMCNNSLPSPVGLTGGQTGYVVTAGYDEATGLGSLDAQAFIDNYLSAGHTTATVTVSGTEVSVVRGSTAGNTSTVTVTPANGFTGAVTLTAAISSGPAGAYAPSLSFGATSPVNITGTAGQTAILTVSTTAASASADTDPLHRQVFRGRAQVRLPACCSSSIPKRHRRRFAKLGMLGFALLLTGGMVACGGGGGSSGGSGGGGTGIAGTAVGTYVVTVTCTSGTTTLSTGTLTLRVQ